MPDCKLALTEQSVQSLWQIFYARLTESVPLPCLYYTVKTRFLSVLPSWLKCFWRADDVQVTLQGTDLKKDLLALLNTKGWDHQHDGTEGYSKWELKVCSDKAEDHVWSWITPLPRSLPSKLTSTILTLSLRGCQDDPPTKTVEQVNLADMHGTRTGIGDRSEACHSSV